VSEPRRIGKYLVERALGAGAFATVWLAYDELLETRVAVKVLADNWARNQGVRQRFIDEARILRRIDHDRIVRVHEINEQDGQPYFVMALADRGSLHERIAGRPADAELFPVERALRLGIEICDALSIVHDFGVVHRDIKPSNILFRSVRTHERIAAQRAGRDIGDESIMLGDFGLAKDLAAASGFTLAAGTPAYMAPEQAQSSAVIDRRVDVFAATAVFYEMLAGRPAFSSDTLSGVRRSRATVTAERLTNVRKGLPPAIDRVIEQGLARNPDDRYPSAVALGEALQELLDHAGAVVPSTTVIAGPPPQPGPAPPPPPPPRPPEPVGAAGRVLDLVSSVRTKITSPDGIRLLGEAEHRLSRPITVAVVGDARSGTHAAAWGLFGATPTPATLEGLAKAQLRLSRGHSPHALHTSRTGSGQPLTVTVDRNGHVQVANGPVIGPGSRVLITLAGDATAGFDVVSTPSVEDPPAAFADVVVVLVAADSPAPAEPISILSATLRRVIAGPVSVEALVAPIAGAPPAAEVAAAVQVAPGVGALVPNIEPVSSQAIARIRRSVDELVGYRAPLIRAAAGLKLLTAAADGASSPAARAEILEGVEALRSEIPTLMEIDLLHDLTSGKAMLPPMLRSDLRRLLLHAQPATRLGLAAGTDPATLRAKVEQTGTEWRVLENTGRIPFSARRAMLIAQQSLDRLHAELAPYG
jgi:serine/threonine protein kinase